VRGELNKQFLLQQEMHRAELDELRMESDRHDRIEQEQVQMELDKIKNELSIEKTINEHMRVELEQLNKAHSMCTSFSACLIKHSDVKLYQDKRLGGGAWGYVVEGLFRGQRVAVKCVHSLVLSEGTHKRVRREVATMAQVRHPNLVLFIGAVLDDQGGGGPLIITELLDTTLRNAYEKGLLERGKAKFMNILVEVASALSYLHQHETPIIHRDVSSANVLLEAMAKGRWKAKLSDFGSANWVRQAVTLGEGSIVYTAPEAYPVPPWGGGHQATDHKDRCIQLWDTDV
jgi:serine/threonine protein kinase